jgi:hypothetical protein
MSKAAKPKVTTLCYIELGDFEENEKQVLLHIQEMQLPVHVDQEAADGYQDCSVGDCITLEAISEYHLKDWTEKSLIDSMFS